MLAIFGGAAGIIGTFFGGCLADRLGVNDKRCYPWLSVIAGGLALPIGFPFLLSGDITVLIGFIFLVTIYA